MNRLLTSMMVAAAALLGVAAASPPAINVSAVWSRPATGTGVIYATIHNTSSEPDRLIGATSPAASHVGLHQSSESAGTGMRMSAGSMSTMPMGSAMMTMKTLSAIPIPAGGTTTLAPGGYHLMLDLRHDLKPGETIAIRLHFARAGWIAAAAHVRPMQ